MGQNIEIERLEACEDVTGRRLLEGKIAMFDAHMIHKHYTLVQCTLFQKGDRRWMSFPSHKWVDKKTGEEKYEEKFHMDTKEMDRALKMEILKEIDEELKVNPEMKPKSVAGPADGDDCPF